MTVYQELQLNAAGSKALVRNAADQKEKCRHLLIYFLKVFLTSAFCMAVVTIYSVIFGSENSIAGVVVLLALLVLRMADFGIKTTQGVGVIFLLFGILTAGPRISNMLPAGFAFLFNLVCIFSILIISCHNIIMSNQFTFVLCYLLLQGYDVTGEAYLVRVAALMSGAVICALIFYKNQRKRIHKRCFSDLFREFDLQSVRTRWYIKFSLGVSSVLLAASLLQLPRAMWSGIAVMSTMLPFTEDTVYRVKRRIPFNIVGSLIFLLLYYVLPDSIYANIGLIGGIGVGFSASYSFQTIFNTFGALVVAANLFGPVGAVALRIICNAFGACYSYVFDKVFTIIFNRLSMAGARKSISA